MKINRVLLTIMLLLWVALPVLAQNTNLPPVPVGDAPAPDVIPIESASTLINSLLLMLATVVSPMLVRLAKTLIPKIPTRILPAIGPIVMVVGNWISDIAGGPSVNIIAAGFFGAMGNGLREIKEMFVSAETKAKRVDSSAPPTSPVLVTSKLPLLLLCGTLTLGVSGCAWLNPEGIKPAAVEEGQDSVVVNAERVQKTSLYAYNRMINWEMNNRAVLPKEVSRAVDQARLNFLPNWEQSRIALKEYQESRGGSLENLHRLTTALSVAQSNFLKLTGSGSVGDISSVLTALTDLKSAVDVLRK